MRANDTIKTLAFALAALLIIGAAGLTIAVNHGFESRLSQDVLNVAAAQTDINPRREECHEKDVDSLRKHGGCKILISDDAKDFPLRYLSFGDSFSNTLMPMLEDISKEYRVNGIQTSFSSCPPVIGIERFQTLEGNYRYPCREFNDTVLDIIKREKIKHVILFARWSAYTNEYIIGDGSEPPASMKESVGIFEKNLLRTIGLFTDMGVQVWVIKQPPEYPFNVPQILSRAKMFSLHSSPRQISYDDYERQQETVNTIFEKAAANFPKAHFIDPARPLCPPPENKCLMEKDGHSLYRDSNHLSVTGIMYAAPLFNDMFQIISGRR